MRQIKILASITKRDSESLSAFLREINKYEIPTLEEEVALAQRIHKGDHEALNELVTRNLRFVVSVAKQSQRSGLPLGDLIAEGCVGLMTAAEKFDETRGFKFCTYAVWWIRQAIMKAVSEYSSMVKLPSNQRNAIHKASAAKAKFEAEYFREPSKEELSELAGVDLGKLSSFDTIGRVVTSLDTPIGDEEDGGTLVDLISDPNMRTDSWLEKESLHQDLMRVMSILSDKERKVLVMVFGLDGRKNCTIDEIAETMGITRERTRQIRESGLRRIRNNVASVSVLRKYCAA